MRNLNSLMRKLMNGHNGQLKIKYRVKKITRKILKKN